jgi:hypothetical protein
MSHGPLACRSSFGLAPPNYLSQERKIVISELVKERLDTIMEQQFAKSPGISRGEEEVVQKIAVVLL